MKATEQITFQKKSKFEKVILVRVALSAHIQLIFFKTIYTLFNLKKNNIDLNFTISIYNS